MTVRRYIRFFGDEAEKVRNRGRAAQDLAARGFDFEGVVGFAIGGTPVRWHYTIFANREIARLAVVGDVESGGERFTSVTIYTLFEDGFGLSTEVVPMTVWRDVRAKGMVTDDGDRMIRAVPLGTTVAQLLDVHEVNMTECLAKHPTKSVAPPSIEAYLAHRRSGATRPFVRPPTWRSFPIARVALPLLVALILGVIIPACRAWGHASPSP